ncbi:MAG: hypothetical protein CL878_01025 [Dehalococcoidia bacterium]|nr:hypothetical protein [Dehalococcoidia bacterium]
MDRLITIGQASLIIGLATSTIYKMVHERRIPFVKLGSRLLFSEERIRRWVGENSTEPVASAQTGDRT